VVQAALVAPAEPEADPPEVVEAVVVADPVGDRGLAH
jgi:hypothetical protein